MSGHSKWANIKHRKAAQDSKRGKLFTRLIKEISVAARVGGGDQNANPRLRALLDKAREVNMPQDNTLRAIKRGTGELPGVHYEEQMYEGYGPEGIAILVNALTDNKNRTVAELRRLFSSNGGTLAESGAVSWMFERMGCIRCSGATTEDKLLELLLDYEVHDIRKDDTIFTILCEPKAIESIKHVLKEAGITIESAEVEWIAQNTTPLSKEESEKAYKFLEELDDHDDIQNVYTNLIEG